MADDDRDRLSRRCALYRTYRARRKALASARAVQLPAVGVCQDRPCAAYLGNVCNKERIYRRYEAIVFADDSLDRPCSRAYRKAAEYVECDRACTSCLRHYVRRTNADQVYGSDRIYRSPRRRHLYDDSVVSCAANPSIRRT